jgi:hypothetical protein
VNTDNGARRFGANRKLRAHRDLRELPAANVAEFKK